MESPDNTKDEDYEKYEKETKSLASELEYTYSWYQGGAFVEDTLAKELKVSLPKRSSPESPFTIHFHSRLISRTA